MNADEMEGVEPTLESLLEQVEQLKHRAELAKQRGEFREAIAAMEQRWALKDQIADLKRQRADLIVAQERQRADRAEFALNFQKFEKLEEMLSKFEAAGVKNIADNYPPLVRVQRTSPAMSLNS